MKQLGFASLQVFCTENLNSFKDKAQSEEIWLKNP